MIDRDRTAADPQVDPVDGEVGGGAADGRRPRPGLAAIGAWLVLAGACTALDGVVGLGVAVVVAAVLLAGISPRVLGALGLVALAGVPVAHLVRGLPAPDEVSPFFVAGSLWPHHLAFAGLVLVGSWAVLDARARSTTAAPDAVPRPPGRPPLGLALAIVAVVALAAVAASVAVLAA